MRRRVTYILFIFSIICGPRICAQSGTALPRGREYIDSLISRGENQQAREEIRQQTSYYFREALFDSLPAYLPLVGSRILAGNDWELAVKNAEQFIARIRDAGDTVALKNAYLELANLYDDKGDPKTAFEKALLALELAGAIEDPVKADLEGVHYTLGTKAYNMGDIALSKKHQLRNLALREKSGDQDHEMYYFTYNTMGRLMWFSGQPDSAMYYFRAAKASVRKLDSTPWNQLFRPALLNGNIAILLQAQGEVEQAIETTQEAILWLRQFAKESTNEGQKLDALKQKLISFDNLGAYYNSIGEYARAEKLIAHSFAEKKKNYAPDDINLAISLMLLGQAQMGTRKLEEARQNFTRAIERLKNTSRPNTYYLAFAQTSLGSTLEALGETDQAAAFYQKGEASFRAAMKGDYTKDFLDELADMALFYSRNEQPEKAKKLGNEVYDFVSTGAFEGSLQHYAMLLARAEVYFNLGDYRQALRMAADGLKFSHEFQGSEAKKDSIRIFFLRPKNLLLWAKSRYQLEPEKSEIFLDNLRDSLDKAIGVLRQRKSILKSYEDLSLLMEENRDIFSFKSQLENELYQLTRNRKYLAQLLSTIESAVYSRIRTRLNMKAISFTGLPPEIQAREKSLRKSMANSLDHLGTEGPATFIARNREWEAFQDSLAALYPEYYEMRYGSLEERIPEPSQMIPPETSVLRYFYIEKDLYAYLSDGREERLISLDGKDLPDKINRLTNLREEPEVYFGLLADLYGQLWRPLEAFINTRRIVIIPDRELYNLSFELLTGDPISGYSDLKTKSLMARHTISYNYSFMLLDPLRKTLEFQGDFIAFAPEFDTSMKKQYVMALKDSLEKDQAYLSLLPQPFSSDLVRKLGRKFRGNTFLNTEASKQLFTGNAAEHKIIHVGTHAESNNVSPELSRLVFAKNVRDSGNLNDNYLYTYEIYNQNLNANLAVLTACETGKPGYQPGEGMISLAHAFNYAGSESILTSLWQVDEQSSTQILTYFYEFLEAGKAKDEALRLAKMAYLENAEGRMRHPQYWAGLILMGDTEPIPLTADSGWQSWLIGLLVAAAVLFTYFTLRRKTPESR